MTRAIFDLPAARWATAPKPLYYFVRGSQFGGLVEDGPALVADDPLGQALRDRPSSKLLILCPREQVFIESPSDPAHALNVLLVSEKPDAAARVARALDEDGRPRKLTRNGAPIFEARWKGDRLIVASALGHLYALRARGERDRRRYPVYSVEWAPRNLVERDSARIGPWIETLREFNESINVYVNCCDYDLEGSLIGYNVLRYVFAAPEGMCRRMKISTLVEGEIRNAFANLQGGLDFNMISAGETRHIVDFIYGVNLSRALTNAVRPNIRTPVTISTGRVQGPALKFIVEREKENCSFVPIPYWTIQARVDVGGEILSAQHERERIGVRDEVERILSECRGRGGRISSLGRLTTTIAPPPPFDIGALQAEAYGALKFTPSRTLRIAERLYLEALISYPRTSSQKLPESIGYRDILDKLGADYGQVVEELLRQRNLRPQEGKKDDPAHPAIYPTGQRPERSLVPEERRLLDLVARRFLSAFAPPATRETVRVEVDIGGNKFLLHGRKVLERGWLSVYGPYSAYSDERLPELSEGQDVRVIEVLSEERYTQPPSRFNPASIIKVMEEEGIGTKATRADILDTLYKRGYISGERIEASELGLVLIDTLEKFCPEIISVELTAELEDKMAGIESGELDGASVIAAAKDKLDPSLEKIRERDGAIGKSLGVGVASALVTRRVVGDCHSCGSGQLMIIRSKRTGKRFIGCSNYVQGKCAYSAPLPQEPYLLKPTTVKCRTCGWPVMVVRRRGGRPWRLCVNTGCSTKKRGPDTRN
jgi:DNA topoisomerase-1